MTEHLLQQHEAEDKQIMRRLFMVIGAFMIATAAMAVTITVAFS